MSKFMPRVYRRDASQDHTHAIPDGTATQGMLAKPSKDRYGWHTHLYEVDGSVYETTPSHDEGDHSHETILGATSGPHAPGKLPGDPWQKQA